MERDTPIPKILRHRTLLAVLLVIAGAVHASPRCKEGFVERSTSAGDTVCVTPASRDRVVMENARAPMLWGPGVFGPRTCAMGFVWRDASMGDQICVPAQIRSLVHEENRTAASRQR